jgi:hypothetical protein
MRSPASAVSTEIVRLDEKDLAEDPARLEVELRTIPMFCQGGGVYACVDAHAQGASALLLARSSSRPERSGRLGRAN